MRQPANDHDIIVRVGTPALLFNAPAVDPFSDLEADVLGQPALVRVAKHLRSRVGRHARRLVIVLPIDEMTPGLDTRIRGAIQRFATMRIQDNDLETVTRRSYGWKGLLLAVPTALAIALLVPRAQENAILRKIRAMSIELRAASS
jgi:hypothetical protein